jgi:uncharacterized protein (TIGR04255 family)
LETDFERFLLRKDGLLPPHVQHTGSHIRLTRGECVTAAQLFPNVKPGQVHRSGKTDGEVKFIFDQDLYMPGKIAPNLSASALQALHAQAWAIFRDAITDELHDAMEPV